MTMHLVRGMTTNSSKRRKSKRKPGWQAAEEKHNKWLKKMGVHPDQLKGKERNAGLSIPEYSESRPTIKTSDAIPGYSPKSKGNEYTGDYIIGIGTMHKSNMVPVTRKKDAVEMAKMRR